MFPRTSYKESNSLCVDRAYNGVGTHLVHQHKYIEFTIKHFEAFDCQRLLWLKATTFDELETIKIFI